MISFSFLHHLSILFAAASTTSSRQYTIRNNCPSFIEVFIGGTSAATLAPNATFSTSLPGDWDGTIRTNLNAPISEENGSTVTICPNGDFLEASASPVQINPNGNTAKCLDVRGAKFANGTPVQIYDCNGTAAQKWLIQHGRGIQVQVAGTPYCLDAGSHPANGVKMKIWTCAANQPAQTWYYTYGTKSGIYLTDTNFALDLTDGSLANGNQVQIYQIYSNSPNQIWTTSPVSS
ncbi:hypothetical protein CVT26_007679 [Gymnopilus dilepis]|uniref:Ricin B lectin domain-containing protein n=1 Tax=Gymnopilus dilepis TaxID=231916 RepID=A0A409WT26_9AGAR|nr:hypothetical protein CVT26_007679 [Gymnopilus dilepis]